MDVPLVFFLYVYNVLHIDNVIQVYDLTLLGMAVYTLDFPLGEATPEEVEYSGVLNVVTLLYGVCAH